jgi:four helix bundle protein
LVRAAIGVSSNYRATGRARSRKEWISRLGIVLGEADDSRHWLDVIKESALADGEELEWLMDESRQLCAIFYASIKTARANNGR